MSSAFARRRADRFDALVGDPTATADDARTAELLELVGALRAVPAPAPRADFSAALRERLLAEADTVLLPRDRTVDARLTLPATTRTAQRTRRDRRFAVAAGTLAVVGATTSMAVAAQTALPGDALYPVKRALEEARTGVSVGDAAKGTTLLASASGRLDELAELARLGTPESAAAVPGTLETFTEQAQAASELMVEDYEKTGQAESIATLRDFTSQSMAELAALEEVLPVSTADALRAAAAVLAEIDAKAAAMCPTCGGSGITEVPLSLLGAASTGLEGLTSPGVLSATDGTATVVRGPGRPIAPQPTAADPAPEVPRADDEIRSPGSVFVPPSGHDGGGRSGDGSDGGLRELLTGGGSATGTSSGVTTKGGPIEPATETDVVAPVVDPLTELLDDALDGR